MARTSITLLTSLTLALLALLAGPAAAQQKPSSEVLLPYFEVDLKANGVTTMFAVGNAEEKAVDILVTVYTNWGIPIAKSTLTLAPNQLRTFDVRNWLTGDLPGRKLRGLEVQHLKAALLGQASPKDKLYYATAVAPSLAVGYVRIKALGNPGPEALWGDYFLLDGGKTFGEGDTLINIDRTTGCLGLCGRHALRFLTGGAFDGGTQVVVWSDTEGQPSKTSTAPGYVRADAKAFDEAGEEIGGSQMRLLPLQVVSVADLGLRKPNGWLDLRTETDSVIAVHYTGKSRFGIALQSYCLRDKVVAGAGLRLRKLTNGEDANVEPGPPIRVGSPVLWEYIVENTGGVEITGIEVTDDKGVDVSCPKDALAAGESMTCTGRGVAEACQYKNIGTVTGRTSTGQDVSAEDPSHYFGNQNAALDIEKLINGQDADAAPGPTIDEGAAIAWTYVVTNKGDVALSGIQVHDDDKGLAPSCPKTSLRPGESMTCTAQGKAQAGPYQGIGTAKGATSCGSEVRDEDPGHYTGRKGDEPKPEKPAIDIEKHTNGHDADTPKGPEIAVGKPVLWEYFVTNTGDVALSAVKVADDQGVAVSCPKAALNPGETMRCTGNGTATEGQYRNLGTVTGTSPKGATVRDEDPSHYYGRKVEEPKEKPAIDIEKHTNGHDADVPKGPEIEVGKPVLWEYFVTNTGDVALSAVKVVDDQGVVVSCPKAALQPGETMRCTGNGTATAGQYRNLGTVTGTSPRGATVRDEDPSHYYGVTPPATGTQGCTPGYWKNHEDSWAAAGYQTSQKVQSVFAQAAGYPSLGNATLHQALSFNGGSTIEGAAGNLLRAAVASLLDASHPGVDYPRTPASVISDVNAALATRNRDTILALASAIDRDNNLGCPLN